MSNRRKRKRDTCDKPGCHDPASHILVDGRGERIHSCDGCWAALVMAIESMGGRVGPCGCRVCAAIPGRRSGAAPDSVSGRGGREPATGPRPGAQTARADTRTGTLRAPV